jgi:glycosyltransferase involved in cell wall biosynthesis
MKLLVDGIFYQVNRTGITRVWSSILPLLASYPELEIVMLDRGNCPSITGVEKIEFPSYKMEAYTAADSFLIDELCRELKVDVFTSTYYTTPLTTPSVLMVYDMIPEVLGFDLSQRSWQEKQIAINFASYYSCISENTRSDLMRFYPSIHMDRVIVTHCGVDRGVFRTRDQGQVEEFKRRYEILAPYYVLVGSRKQHLGYKNASLVFNALRSFDGADIELLCIGGETEIDRVSLDQLPSNVSARRVELVDDELACAYSGARALVFPSLYEGFGMPIVEAMASGCPVITTKLGSLGDVAGDAAIFVSGSDQSELRKAMTQVCEPAGREQLIERGLRRAALFNWENMARGFFELLTKAQEERNTPTMQNFFREWKRLRQIQADVDPSI